MKNLVHPRVAQAEAASLVEEVSLAEVPAGEVEEAGRNISFFCYAD